MEVPTGEKKKDLFRREREVMVQETRWEQRGWSDREIDGERLAEDLAQLTHELNEDGYEVINVVPIISGAYHWQYESQGVTSRPRMFLGTEAVSGGGGYSYGYGFS